MSNARPNDQLRPVTIEPFISQAPGSVMIIQGNTRVICTASISDDTPPWLLDKRTGEPRSGWVTAEYQMMPGSTPSRKKRKPDSRGTEIQRLIARVLRAAVDLEKMPGLMITCDCDVASADGGTRTASITGACVALQLALLHARAKGLIDQDPIISPVAAVSVGIVDGQAYLDLDYPLDVRAEVDMNVAMTGSGEFVEVQGTGEAGTFTRAQSDELLDLATAGIKQLLEIQKIAVNQLATPAPVA